MKKTFKVLQILLIISYTSTILAACSNSNLNVSKTRSSLSTAKSESMNTVTVKIGEKTQSYQVNKNVSLLDFAVAQLNAEQTKGFITSVGNLKQDTKSSMYVMFKVDGKESTVGAGSVKLMDGEKIEFYLAKY